MGRWLSSIALAACTLAATLAVAELGWRFHLWTAGRGFFDDPHDFPSPFFTIYDHPWPVSHGGTFWFRNGQVSRDKPAGEIRVISFGGSTTVNYRAGVSYPELIEARLAQRGTGSTVRCLNAGGEGYSTAHVLVNLSLRNLDVRPDVITVYENINDLSALEFGDHLDSDYANKYLTDFYLGLRHRTGLLSAVTRVSRLARWAVSRSEALMFPKAATTPGRDWHQGLEYYRRNLRHVVRIANANGIRVLMASQPACDAVRDEAGFAAYNAAAETLAREEGVTFVDLAAAVTDDASFLPDCIHNTRAGVERVADALYEPLRRLVEEVERDRAKR